MLLNLSSDPSPVVQTAVYMAAVAAGYVLLLGPEEWQQVRETIRNTWTGRPRS
jgi:hypothetical protein